MIGTWIACPDKKGARCFVVPGADGTPLVGEPGVAGPAGPTGE